MFLIRGLIFCIYIAVVQKYFSILRTTVCEYDSLKSCIQFTKFILNKKPDN